MLITEQALFKMPKDQELQFPAMAVLQSYVNSYSEKMKANDVSYGTARFRLFYDAEMPEEDWQFFQRAGLKLSTNRVKLEHLDMVFDLTEDRVESMCSSGKHVCQIYGVMTGVGCPAWPTLRKVHPKMDGGTTWGVGEGVHKAWADVARTHCNQLVLLDADTLLSAEDNQWTGVIGRASRLTYLACSMGIPTIEILPENREVSFLSKFGFSAYRVIERQENVERGIAQAMANIHQVLHYLHTKELCAQSKGGQYVPSK
jgi:hypothetical protein